MLGFRHPPQLTRSLKGNATLKITFNQKQIQIHRQLVNKISC